MRTAKQRRRCGVRRVGAWGVTAQVAPQLTVVSAPPLNQESMEMLGIIDELR